MKSFTSTEKINNYFTRRLNKMVNNATDRTRLPCPFSRVSEILIYSKCVSNQSETSFLNELYERHEKLERKIKKENIDLKGIIGRQGRELVSGKVRNLKVMYESEIYLLSLSIQEAQANIEKYKKSLDSINYLIQSMKDDDSDHENNEEETRKRELQSTEKAIAQIQMECELLMAQIDEIQRQINCSMNQESENGNQESDDDNQENGNVSEAEYELTEGEIEARSNIACLQQLPELVQSIFAKLITPDNSQ